MNVRLRSLRAEDGPRVLAWRNSEAVAPHMYSDHVITPDEHARWLAGALAGEDRRYWIVELDGAASGLASLVRMDRTSGRAELGYYLAELAARGRGLGSAAKFAVLEHAFGALGLRKLWSEVLAENDASSRLLESIGFTREACYRGHVRKQGRWRDVFGYGLLARDWAAARGPLAAKLRTKGFDLSVLRVED